VLLKALRTIADCKYQSRRTALPAIALNVFLRM
jgi:hypothetical protein